MSPGCGRRRRSPTAGFRGTRSNGFGLDEEEAAEAKVVAEEWERERRRAEGRETPLAPLEAYKLRKELRKMHVQGVHA